MRNFSFGLDFGTSKTAIALAEADISSQIEVLAIDQNHKERIPTCLLLRDRDTDKEQVWIGQEAEDEMRLEPDPTLARLEFFANFKPHIHHSLQDREAARRFLTAMARADGVANELRRRGSDALVAAGSPVSWQADGDKTLLDILNSAGFPPAYTVPEPVGAALYFYTARKLKAQDLQRDIVVFDWGAGTFDITLLRAGQIKIHSNWGSAICGGRLFDDLFFQWMLDIAANNGHQKDVEELNRRPVERRYLHGFICREIKESFSAAYATARARNARDRAWTYKHTVTIGVGKKMIDLGNFAVPRFSEFYDRASAYRASDLARAWLQLPADQVLAAEQFYLDTLLAGGAVDLLSWGKVVVIDGLKEFGVEKDAIAVLTGGSCNWQWFKDFVCTLPAFQHEDNVHIDLKPELTIARGLARAYAVGRYSKQLIDQIEQKRSGLEPQLSRFHSEPLRDLGFSINAEMKNDKALQQEVRRIFADSYRDAFTTAAPLPDNGLLSRIKEMLARFFKGVINESPAELALRTALQQTIGAWLSSHELILQRRWGERFTAATHDKIMMLLKKELDLKGLVEVAVDACSATGPMTFQRALEKLGGQVNIGSVIVTRLHRELSKLWRQMISANNSPEITPERIDEQAKAATEQFFENMPEDIRGALLQVQSAHQWACGLVDDLIGTLKTVAEFARADSAARISEA